MRKTTILFVLAALMVGIMPSCKRKYATEDKTVTIYYKDGSSVTKTYKVTAPDENLNEEEEIEADAPAKAPKLRACKAKRLIRQQMKENDQIILTQPVTIGYYECNCPEQRANLYKLAVNNIISFKCDEIINDGQPTYWVTVDLTWKGRMLCVEKTKKYPEDKIDWDLVQPLLTPQRDQDSWGIPTFDNQVDSLVFKGMHAFYAALAQGLTLEHSLLSADMQCAMYLFEALKSFDVDKLNPCPFCRNLALTPEMVDQMQILRMPRLVNGYMVSIGGEDFLYAMAVENGQLQICDVVCTTPDADKVLTPTVCSLAGQITEQDILKARADKRRNDEEKEKMAQNQKNQSSKESDKEEEHFEMCNIDNQGIARVEHTDPTLYEIAKEQEFKQVVALRAAKLVVKKVRNIKVDGDRDNATATAVAVIRTSRVSAAGRIFQQLKQGSIEKRNVNFVFDEDEGWKISSADAVANAPVPEVEEEKEESPAAEVSYEIAMPYEEEEAMVAIW